jgi:hypothetical protein
MDAASDPVGSVPVERMAAVKGGMTADEVRAILGEPASIERSSLTQHGIVWIYRHHRRGKFLLNRPMASYLEFRDGVLLSIARVQFEGQGP